MSFPSDPYIDTVFSEDFSFEKFGRVTVGIREEQVKNIIGEPIVKQGSCWNYTANGKASPYADFSYYLYQICFKEGRVESKPVHEFFD